MLSCVEWIPRGVAQPMPKRFDFPKGEINYVCCNNKDKINSENELKVDNFQRHKNINKECKNLEQIKGSTNVFNHSSNYILPDDLRMDEYSSNDDNSNEANVVGLIAGQESGEKKKPNYHESTKTHVKINDVSIREDTIGYKMEKLSDLREYLTTNIQGLQSIQIGSHRMDSGILNEEDSDIEDTAFRSNDALIIVAKMEEDFASLEVHVYEERCGNLYVHHDIPLPDYPICLAHGKIDSYGNSGNFVAVGTFDPRIEIWNLDIMDTLEPISTLGSSVHSNSNIKTNSLMGFSKMSKSDISIRDNRKRNKDIFNNDEVQDGNHTAAVMSLSWNSIYHQLIASGSSDSTIKIWDILRSTNMKPVVTFTNHSDKVQSVAWHPKDGALLASGSFDQSLCIIDSRIANGCQNKKVKLLSDCEAIIWDPHNDYLLSAATECGSVTCWDVRKFETRNFQWSFVAHSYGGCKGLSCNLKIPGMMATCSTDKTVALWDTGHVTAGKNPSLCCSKYMKVGKIYSVSFYPSSPWLLACGGSENELAVWDFSIESLIRDRFSNTFIS